MSTTKQNPAKIIALFGGTFDPIHLGHILPVQATAKWLGAEQLHLIPAHIPPHKIATHASASQRAEMVSIVCQQYNYKLDKRELNRKSRSYTVDTLHEIKAEQPQTSLYFIMGMDSLLSFTQWYKWQDILNLCNLVVNIRPGYDHDALETKLEPELSSRLVYNIEQLKRQQVGQILIHESKELDISSTSIRAKIKAGENCRQLLPEAIYNYIEQNKLYR